MRSCAILAVLATVAVPGRLPGQSLPQYRPGQFACVIYRVHVHTSVNTDLQGRTRREEVDRDGLLQVHGTPVAGGTAIEAWWDSLTLSRRTDEDSLAPDASGILGGRYRGVLHADGRFDRTAAPWVPDEVAEVSDLGVALDDLFPVFRTGGARRVGGTRGEERWRIGSDSTVDLPATTERPFAVRESAQSDGVATWDREGLAAWSRTITSETRVRDTPRRTFRSQVDQRIEMRRVAWCGSGGAGGIAH